MIHCEFENGNKGSLRHATVNALVLKDNKILLGLRGTLNGKPILESGKWGLLGGFMDRDETLKQAIEREIMEESGWRVENLKLLTIIDRPDRPCEDRQNLSFVYIADAKEKIQEHDEEVSKLEWFDLDNLPEEDLIAFDFYESLQLYKKYLKENLTLPILE